MSQRILLVEDDRELGYQIVGHLESAGFEATWRTDGDDLPALGDYSLLILDLMLPGTSGMDVLKELRTHADLPVLILSARNDTVDKVRALKLGADDYMTKPFWPEELVERVRARLRRPMLSRDGAIEVGDLRIDVHGRVVEVGGVAIELTRAEFDLLAVLARRPGAAVTREALVDQVLDPERDGGARTLDVHVSRLRKKLGPGEYIATVWGIGYRLVRGDE